MAEEAVEIREAEPDLAASGLVRQLGLFDVTMLVMGGIIGTGIFVIPHIVAQQVHTTTLILSAWLLGGLVSLFGAFIYAELAARQPKVGGQYAYLRNAYHPAVAFAYGWSLLLIVQTGAMASVAIIFARYFVELTRVPVDDWIVAALAIGALTVINCFGVRIGSTTQNAFMVLKILAIAGLIICGLLLSDGSRLSFSPALDRPVSVDLMTAFGAAMISVLFAYDGWQMAGFIGGEVRQPRRNLPRGLILGMTAVVAFYVLINLVCVWTLGADQLAQTATPASEVMRRVLGERGAAMIAVGITISALGYLSQATLTSPRVYFAMAEDGLFFKSVGWLHPRTRVPVVAILLQGACAIVIALAGGYGQILNYVMSAEFVFFGLTASSLFVVRRRARQASKSGHSAVSTTTAAPPSAGDVEAAYDAGAIRYSTPGHPVTTGIFVVVCGIVALNLFYTYPVNSIIGIVIILAGVPVYFFWRWYKQDRRAPGRG